MIAHSKIGASTMERWSACPGSVKLCSGLPSRTSKYADEGTAAHELAAAMLQNQPWKKPSEEMFEAVKVYVDLIEEEQKGATKVFVEHGFHLSDIHPDAFGTADCVIYYAEQGLLRVYDYKHGAGISVDVENNSQLKYYALGALLSTALPAREVELVIVQPRCPHPGGIIRRWRFPAFEILDFAADLLDAIRRTEAPNAPLVSGDHCRFCPASAVCPALSKQAVELAKQEFSPTLSYDPKKLSKMLELVPVLEAWTKNVREFAFVEAQHGREIPGWKLVAKRATRKWKEDEDSTIEKLCTEFKVEICEILDTKLKSPAQVEKIIPKNLKSKARLSDLVVQESTGATLVLDSDPRPSLKLDAKSEFLPIEQGETE